MEIELLIENNGKFYTPTVKEGLTWHTDRKGSPGELKFSVVKDETINFTEGSHVRLKVDDKEVFYGFVFTKKRDKGECIDVTVYDQLRYLKNKDTYVYENLTAGGLIQMIADDFRLQTGNLEDTGFKIASRVEDNTTLFDMIQYALDLTLENKKEMYVMFDSFGKITLKNISSMVVDLLVDEETGENFNYTSTIDSNTYNKIKLSYDNESTGLC